jgi:hypothetical protein
MMNFHKKMAGFMKRVKLADFTFHGLYSFRKACQPSEAKLQWVKVLVNTHEIITRPVFAMERV